MARRHISVRLLLEKANDLLLHTEDGYIDKRFGISDLVQDILYATDNYKGFRFLTNDDMAKSRFGKSVGVIYNIDTLQHFYPDRSRRQYF